MQIKSVTAQVPTPSADNPTFPMPTPALIVSTRRRPVPETVTVVYGSVTLCVCDYGADPTGAIDSTAAFNAAIAALPLANGGVVDVPKGKYLIDAVMQIKLRSNMWFRMHPETILLVVPNNQPRYAAFYSTKLNNVLVTDGQVIGDRDGHDYSLPPIVGQKSHEWGHCFGVYGSQNIVIRGVKISEFTGDGISVSAVGKVGDSDYSPCSNIFIIDTVCDHNRRQGLSVGKVHGLVARGCTFSRTEGTMPQDGIDIEPENGDSCENIFIDGCFILGCAKNGIEMNQRLNVDSPVSGVQITNTVISGNAGYGVYIQRVDGLEMAGNTIQDNAQWGMYVGPTAVNVNIAENTLSSNFNKGKLMPRRPRAAFAQVGVDNTVATDFQNRNPAASVVTGRNYYE